MTDPRLSPPAADITLNEKATILSPVVDLTRGPGGPRDRQLLFGEPVTVLNRRQGACLVRAEKDGYCGCVPEAAVGSFEAATHRVTARATHAYSEPDFKSPDRALLSFGAHISARSETAIFVESALGFVPRQHVHRSDALAEDPAAVAEIFLGAPYLWGGNSSLGIDCSGLVQAACLACGIACPGDSDLQERQLGHPLPGDVTLRRNDVVFWKGHVALVFDDETLLHANAGHMSVVLEPIRDAIARIEAQGDGLPTAMKRLVLP